MYVSLNMHKILIILIFSIALLADNDKSDLEYQLEIEKLKNKILQLEKDLLEEQLKNANKRNIKDNDKSKKRKSPNPNYKHNIKIGNSVVLGNPYAKVTIIKFSDYQ